MSVITAARMAKVLNYPIKVVLASLFDHMNVSPDDPIRKHWPLGIVLNERSARRYADTLSDSDRQKIMALLS